VEKYFILLNMIENKICTFKSQNFFKKWSKQSFLNLNSLIYDLCYIFSTNIGCNQKTKNILNLAVKFTCTAKPSFAFDITVKCTKGKLGKFHKEVLLVPLFYFVIVFNVFIVNFFKTTRSTIIYNAQENLKQKRISVQDFLNEIILISNKIFEYSYDEDMAEDIENPMTPPNQSSCPMTSRTFSFVTPSQHRRRVLRRRNLMSLIDCNNNNIDDEEDQ
jgi:hypothetical protein